jgi:fructose-bisphosphate aldolase (EC 4.1.2.13)
MRPSIPTASRLQRQQPRTGARHHGSRRRDQLAGHPAGLAGARKYAGAPFLRHLIEAAVEEWPHIPVVMHQDHGTSPGVCQRSIQLGFSSVMMDGSLGTDGKTPTTYEYNVDVTRRTVEMSHPAACRSKANSVAWARSKPAPPVRKTASAPKARSTTASC